MMEVDIPECPKHFCFNFIEAGMYFSSGIFNSLDEALESANVVALQDRCSWSGCRRWTRNASDSDFYEPYEPELDKAGLAHDHFKKL
jgi:hypothetical protein